MAVLKKILQSLVVLGVTATLIASGCISPQIENRNIQCNDTACWNEWILYRQFTGFSLTIILNGTGPFNVSWFFNNTLKQHNDSVYGRDSFNCPVIGNPLDYQGYYTANISNDCGFNTSIFYVEYYCLLAVPENNHQSTNKSTHNLIIGDKLMLSFNFSRIDRVLICFTRNLTSLVLSDVDHYCVKCIPALDKNHCHPKPNITNNTMLAHNYEARYQYSPCPLSFLVHLYKHEMSYLDSGSITFATFNGESYRDLEIVQIQVSDHDYSYIGYIIASSAIVVVVPLVVLMIMRLLKKRRSLSLDDEQKNILQSRFDDGHMFKAQSRYSSSHSKYQTVKSLSGEDARIQKI